MEVGGSGSINWSPFQPGFHLHCRPEDWTLSAGIPISPLKGSLSIPIRNVSDTMSVLCFNSLSSQVSRMISKSWFRHMYISPKRNNNWIFSFFCLHSDLYMLGFVGRKKINWKKIPYYGKVGGGVSSVCTYLLSKLSILSIWPHKKYRNTVKENYLPSGETKWIFLFVLFIKTQYKRGFP